MVKVKSFILQFFALCFLLGGVSSSCRQVTKKIVREVTEESTEELAEKGSKKALKEGAEKAGAKILKKEAKIAIKQLASENKLFADIWEQAPQVLRKSVIKSIEDNLSLIHI